MNISTLFSLTTRTSTTTEISVASGPNSAIIYGFTVAGVGLVVCFVWIIVDCVQRCRERRASKTEFDSSALPPSYSMFMQNSNIFHHLDSAPMYADAFGIGRRLKMSSGSSFGLPPSYSTLFGKLR